MRKFQSDFCLVFKFHVKIAFSTKTHLSKTQHRQLHVRSSLRSFYKTCACWMTFKRHSPIVFKNSNGLQNWWLQIIADIYWRLMWRRSRRVIPMNNKMAMISKWKWKHLSSVIPVASFAGQSFIEFLKFVLFSVLLYVTRNKLLSYNIHKIGIKGEFRNMFSATC